MLPPAIQERPRLPERILPVVVPRRPNRPRQRASRERQMLALRPRSRKKENEAMVFQNHRICRRTLRRHRRPRLARQNQNHAEKLDRPLRRRRDRLQSKWSQNHGLYYSSRHDYGGYIPSSRSRIPRPRFSRH